MKNFSLTAWSVFLVVVLGLGGFFPIASQTVHAARPSLSDLQNQLDELKSLVADLQAQIDALELKEGPPGPQGPKGDTGEQGPQGPPGEGCEGCVTDNDGDGYVSSVDCNEDDPDIHPGANEICGDNTDNDCDDEVDEGCGSGYVDNDDDGYDTSVDCDDTNPNIHPGADELCDGVDNDCDDELDEGCGSGQTDNDGDGYDTPADCDDTDPDIHPGTGFDICDGVDNDCDYELDEDATCDDGNSCTTDTCGGLAGCVHTPVAFCCGNGECEEGEDHGSCPDDCAAQGASNLFFSEYLEGSANNKALEIYNTGDAVEDLTACEVRIYANGDVTPTRTISLAPHILTPGDVFVICHPSIFDTVPHCDMSYSLNFNGDDTVELACGEVTYDVFGQIGLDPGVAWVSGEISTKDHTLRRKCSVTSGDPDGSDAFDPALEWDGFSKDTLDGLGAHCQ